MKISIIRKFVVSAVGAAFALSLLACGGLGSSSPQLAHGIYVATKNGNNLQFSADMAGTNGHTIAINQTCYSTAVDKHGNLYVGTSGGVKRLNNADGSVQTLLSGIPFAINTPTAICFDSQNRMYVSVFGGLKIIRVDDMSGTGLQEIDLTPYSVDAYDMGISMALDSQGRIYVAGNKSNKIIRFSSMTDMSPVTYTPSGMTTGTIGNILGMAIDSNDHIYVGDRNNSRVVRFDDMTGANWVSLGTTGSGVNQFLSPNGFGFDEQGRIYIADGDNHRCVRIDDMTGTGWTMYGTSTEYPDMYGIAVH